jgi:hypothetical protein
MMSALHYINTRSLTRLEEKQQIPALTRPRVEPMIYHTLTITPPIQLAILEDDKT